MKVLSYILTVTAISYMLAGCAATPPPVLVVADSFCQAAKKRTWSVDDTVESINDAVRYNAGIDRACGIKTPSS